MALPKEATEEDMSLRKVESNSLLSAELSLMWRVVCTWLQVRIASSLQLSDTVTHRTLYSSVGHQACVTAGNTLSI